MSSFAVLTLRRRRSRRKQFGD